jgi:hypothetical protein
MHCVNLHDTRKPSAGSPSGRLNCSSTGIETDIRLGYFTHLETDWRDVLRTANEISIAHGFELACRAPDLLHVAYANELAAEEFVSFDGQQLALAKASGLGIKAFAV